MTLINLCHSFNFSCFILTLSLYHFRILGATHRRFVIRDLFNIFFTSIVIAVLLTLPWLNSILFIFFTLLFILMWCNIVAVHYFGIKLNWHIIKVGATGGGHFKDEALYAIKKMSENPKLLTLPVFTLVGLTALFLTNSTVSLVLTVIFSVYFLAVASKSKINQKTVLYWCIVLAIVVGITFIFSRDILSALNITSPYACLLLLVLMLFYLCKFFLNRKSDIPFYKLPTMLQAQFKDDKLSLDLLNQAPELTQADRQLITLEQQTLQASPHFGSCPKASIILITTESLTNFYFADEAAQQEHLPFFTELSKTALVSGQHISPSALTNNAMQIIYGGRYPGKGDFPHLAKLKALGYTTCYLTSQKTSEFNLDKMLAQIGFDHIIDNHTLSGDKHKRLPDNEFFPKVTEHLKPILQQDKPFFLHIINNQTHGPYFTYDKKILNRKERYLQAVKESDRQMRLLMNDLQTHFNLDNTIVIYTGDHGESFGEEGYISHANSIIQPQIQVPFLLYHRNLEAKHIPFSNHFDIFPTLFDLLGEPYDYQVKGHSLYHPKHYEHCLVYCETRMGNTPSSFGIVRPESKIYFDRHLAKYQIRDRKDHTIEELTGEQYNAYLKMMLLALQERGLIF